MANILTRRRVITGLSGTEGSFDDASLVAANAKALVFNPKIDVDVDMYKRTPARTSIGALAPLPGKRFGKLAFDMEFKGSGTAGTAPTWGTYLEACGFGKTITTGVAAIGTVNPAPTNTGTGTGAIPLITGTFTGTKSGIWRFTLRSVIANTSASMDAEFFPSDGTAATVSTVTVTATPGTIGLGLSIANVPTATTGWRAGDEWYMTATSSSQVDVTYKTISSAIPCLDIGYYQDGRLYKLHSCRGNAKLKLENGKPGMWSFDFMGCLAANPSDAALLSSIAFQNVVPPQFMGVTATLFSATPQFFTNIDIDMGNKVVPRPNAMADSGISSFRLSDREVTGKIDPEANTIATFDPFSRLFAGTTGNLALTIGSTAGNIVKVTAPNVQLTKYGEGDREGLTVDDLDLSFNEPEYDAGGDYSEIVIIAK
jgi:hypothetical protein